MAGVASGATINPELAQLVLRRIVENAEVGIKHKRGKALNSVKLESTFNLDDLTIVKRD